MTTVSCDCLNDVSVFTDSANSLMSKEYVKSNEIEKKGWYNLEPEVLAIIFKYLRWPERFKLDQVSRHWRNVMKSNQFLNVGVVMWDEYSKRWPKLTFDKLIHNLAVVRQKIISGIDIASLSRPRIHSIDSYELTGGLQLKRSWDHFKVVRFHELTGGLELMRTWDHFKVVRFHRVDSVMAGFDSMMNVFHRQAINLEELMIVVWKIDGHNIKKVDLSPFQHLKKVNLMNCFPVTCFLFSGAYLTTLSIAYSRKYSANRHYFDLVTNVLIQCAGTLRTLKLCYLKFVGSHYYSAECRTIIFPRLVSLTIDAVRLEECYLNIDLSESKLKHLNYAACTYAEVDTKPIGVDFRVIQNVLTDKIESLNIKLLPCFFPIKILDFIENMKGSCYPKLCHFDLELQDHEFLNIPDIKESVQNESESIVASVLYVLDNAENLNYIRLKHLIRSTKDLIRIVIKMKYLKRAFQVEVGSIDDTGTSFWGKLVEQLEIENIESNDCEYKIELKCLFDYVSVENDDLMGELKEKYNIYGVGECITGWVYPESSDF